MTFKGVILKALVPRGRAVLAFTFERNHADTSGTAHLYINGQVSAQASLLVVIQGRDAALFLGRAAGSPVSTAFAQPFAFTGTLEKVIVELQ